MRASGTADLSFGNGSQAILAGMTISSRITSRFRFCGACSSARSRPGLHDNFHVGLERTGSRSGLHELRSGHHNKNADFFSF